MDNDNFAFGQSSADSTSYPVLDGSNVYLDPFAFPVTSAEGPVQQTIQTHSMPAAVQQQYIVPQHQLQQHQHQQLVVHQPPQPPQPAYNAMFQYPFGVPNAPGSELGPNLSALGFQQHHHSRLSTVYPDPRPTTLQPPAPIFSTSNIRMSSFEAYAKNDTSGCTSGVISGLSAKPEVTQTRKRISPEQTAILEEAFQRIPKADKAYRDELAMRTGLPTRTIQIWFQNRRAKAKQKKEPAFLKKEPPKNAESPSAKSPSIKKEDKTEDNKSTPPEKVSPTTNRPQQQPTPQLTSGSAFKGESTLNPPPHPTQRAHNGKQQQMLHDAFLQAPSSSGKITSQVIHVPTTVGHHSGSIGPSPQISKSPQFRLSAVPTPISASSTTPFPHSASSSHSFMDLRSASSTGSKKMKRSFSSEFEPPSGLVRGNPASSYVSPSGTSFDIIEGAHEAPVVLTPMSSLQSPNVSPYCGSTSSSASGMEKRTPVTAATSVFPEPIGFGSAKRRRPNQFSVATMTPVIRSERSFESPVAAEVDFSGVLQSPTLEISPSSSYHDLSPGVANQSPTGSVTPAETLAAAAQLRRSLSASGLNMFHHSRRPLRQRSVANPYRHGSISGSTPSVVASSTLSSMETLRDPDSRYLFDDFTFCGGKRSSAEENVSPRDEIREESEHESKGYEEPLRYGTEENEFDMLIGAYENRAAPVTTDSFEWM